MSYVSHLSDVAFHARLAGQALDAALWAAPTREEHDLLGRAATLLDRIEKTCVALEERTRGREAA